jgi:hypothetical protein
MQQFSRDDGQPECEYSLIPRHKKQNVLFLFSEEEEQVEQEKESVEEEEEYGKLLRC